MAEVEKVLETPAAEEPVKKTRKPRAKKAETEAVKAAAKEAPKKAAAEAAPKKTAKKAAAEAAPKKTAATKKTAAAKTEKAPTTRKTAAKKAVPAHQATVYIQFGGNEVAAKDILEAAKKAFAEANEGVEIETIELYVKPEEGAAYYVVNGVGGDDMKIEL